jgi:5-methyltetrahydropteroyltriglutamate--homocysteine methyltransferase
MKISTDRILTTHTGSLPRPAPVANAIVAMETGELSPDQAEALPGMIRDAVAEVVKHQAAIGLDLISDGEMSKIGSSTYVKERLTGFDGEPTALSLADLNDFPEFAPRALAGLVTATPACTGPVTYVGQHALRQDLEDLRAGLSGHQVSDVFVPAPSPGVISLFLANQYYPAEQDYLAALAEAMRTEYEAIVAAGFLVQIDSCDLAMGRHAQYAKATTEEFVNHISMHVEALNAALANIDPTRVRLHLCWGNYEGPHNHDVDLADILPTVLKARAQALVLEASNPRHGHEWRVFEDVALPDDKVLIPGVIDTSSNHIEHPALIAERITRYAQIVGRERVIAGTDCGFSTFASFLPVQPRIAWAKLASLVEGAHLASKRLW